MGYNKQTRYLNAFRFFRIRRISPLSYSGRFHFTCFPSDTFRNILNGSRSWLIVMQQFTLQYINRTKTNVGVVTQKSNVLHIKSYFTKSNVLLHYSLLKVVGYTTSYITLPLLHNITTDVPSLIHPLSIWSVTLHLPPSARILHEEDKEQTQDLFFYAL